MANLDYDKVHCDSKISKSVNNVAFFVNDNTTLQYCFEAQKIIKSVIPVGRENFTRFSIFNISHKKSKF